MWFRDPTAAAMDFQLHSPCCFTATQSAASSTCVHRRGSAFFFRFLSPPSYAPRDEPPAELLAKAMAEAERARPPDDELEDLARAARAYVQLLESMQRATAPPAPSPRVPSPRLPSPRTARAEPAPPAASPRPELPGDPPKDEMEKLLLKYEQAKEKLQALELMYPN